MTSAWGFDTGQLYQHKVLIGCVKYKQKLQDGLQNLKRFTYVIYGLSWCACAGSEIIQPLLNGAISHS